MDNMTNRIKIKALDTINEGEHCIRNHPLKKGVLTVSIIFEVQDD